jgi:hypothetical protein
MTYYYNDKPHVQDIDLWRKHFVAMARGQVRPDANGKYHIRHTHNIREKSSIPQIKMVTPIAQSIELAKSELALEPKVYKGRTTIKKSTIKKTSKKIVVRKKSVAKKTLTKKKSATKKVITTRRPVSKKSEKLKVKDVFGKK